jgi:CRISPR-associated endoribonuclease Cas6
VNEERRLDTERRNVHLPVEPERTYEVRVTLLLGELFPLLHDALLSFREHSGQQERVPFMHLGKQVFSLEDIRLEENAADWTGFTTLHSLVEQASQHSFALRNSGLTLEFATLTTFSRGNHKTGYGAHHVLLPLPWHVFQNLARRWEDIAPPELANAIDIESLERYCAEDGIIIEDYNLKTHHVHFTTHQQRGFVGTCVYQLRGPDPECAPGTLLTTRQQLYLLAQLAFYCGIGYKTTMGLGQARCL